LFCRSFSAGTVLPLDIGCSPPPAASLPACRVCCCLPLVPACCCLLPAVCPDRFCLGLLVVPPALAPRSPFTHLPLPPLPFCRFLPPAGACCLLRFGLPRVCLPFCRRVLCRAFCAEHPLPFCRSPADGLPLPYHQLLRCRGCAPLRLCRYQLGVIPFLLLPFTPARNLTSWVLLPACCVSRSAALPQIAWCLEPRMRILPAVSGACLGLPACCCACLPAALPVPALLPATAFCLGTCLPICRCRSACPVPAATSCLVLPGVLPFTWVCWVSACWMPLCLCRRTCLDWFLLLLPAACLPLRFLPACLFLPLHLTCGCCLVRLPLTSLPFVSACDFRLPLPFRLDYLPPAAPRLTVVLVPACLAAHGHPDALRAHCAALPAVACRLQTCCRFCRLPQFFRFFGGIAAGACTAVWICLPFLEPRACRSSLTAPACLLPACRVCFNACLHPYLPAAPLPAFGLFLPRFGCVTSCHRSPPAASACRSFWFCLLPRATVLVLHRSFCTTTLPAACHPRYRACLLPPAVSSPPLGGLPFWVWSGYVLVPPAVSACCACLPACGTCGALFCHCRATSFSGLRCLLPLRII